MNYDLPLLRFNFKRGPVATLGIVIALLILMFGSAVVLMPLISLARMLARHLRRLSRVNGPPEVKVRDCVSFEFELERDAF